MAIPKPVRLLVGVTMALFVILLYNIMQNPHVTKAPLGSEKINSMIRDPNLDREASSHPFNLLDN
jgi:mannosyltransferase